MAKKKNEHMVAPMMAKNMMAKKKNEHMVAPKPELVMEKTTKRTMPGKQSPPGYSAKAIEPKGGKHQHGLQMKGGGKKKGMSKKK